MNGILPVNKPAGFTSFDVIGKLRGILKTKKIGHSGTLDPMATGVLPLFVGFSTKAISLMDSHPKRYLATCQLGLVSDTLDSTGTITKRSCANAITLSQVQNIAKKFVGEISQIPPMYSAVKQNGQKLYQLARKGIEVERKSRLVTTQSISVSHFNDQNKTFQLDVTCSKGTYIRTLIDDIGKELGCGAIMTDLVRLESDGFSITSCYSLEQIEQAVKENQFDSLLIPTDRVLTHLDTVVLSSRVMTMFCNGVVLRKEQVPAFTTEFACVKNEAGQLIGICYQNEKEEIRVKTIFQKGCDL